MLDVLIQTHNEELNLPHALRSLAGWVNRIFIVDSGSTDNTRQIAQSAGATVVQKDWLGYAAQKNWAIDNLPFESDWILILDADESVSDQLREEILRVTQRPTPNVAVDGFYINRLTIFMGRPIRHCGYFPAWNLRLFKRGHARYEQRDVHEHMLVQGKTGQLKGLLIHEDHRGIEHFIAKHNRYSTLEASEIYSNRQKWPGLGKFLMDRVARRRYVKYRLAPKLAMPWALRFIYNYIIRGGFLDRQAGLMLCQLISSYELFIRVKYMELVRTGGKDPRQIDGLAQPEGSPPPVTPEPITTPIIAPQEPPMTPSEPEKPWTFSQNIKRTVWMITRTLLFRPSFHNWYAWRRFLLRTFGAAIGKGVRVRPTSSIEMPWNLDLADGVIVGDFAILYSLGKITVGPRTVISQYAHLCAGTHDHTKRAFPLLKSPITIGADVWIAADAFVGPGVTVADRTVIGARATIMKDVPPDVVVTGPLAQIIKPRVFTDQPPTTINCSPNPPFHLAGGPRPPCPPTQTQTPADPPY